MEHLLYIFTILFFVGIALISQIILAKGRIIKYKLIILYSAVIFFIGSFTDTVAHRWNVWGYGTKHTLHFRVLGTEFETILFCVGAGVVVTIASLLWAEDIDEGRSPTYALRAVYNSISKSIKKTSK